MRWKKYSTTPATQHDKSPAWSMTSLLQTTESCSMSWASSPVEIPAIGTTGEKGPKGPGPKDPSPKGPDPCAAASSSLRLYSHFFVAASVGPSASYVRRST